MPKTKAKPSGGYTVANPRNIPQGVRIFVCANECGVEFFEGETFEFALHPHLTSDWLVRDGFLVKHSNV